ncbi:MAG: thioredoxin family protein [Patescibacteria group bacterium]|jgi:protein-disulfide isomerase
MGKSWIIVIGIVLVVIVVFAIFGYSKISNNSGGSATSSPSPTALSQNQTYFSSDAKIMFFYSDYCHWCQQEEADVLPDLGKQGYKLKPMDIATDSNLASQYKIDGTPTFIAANGDRLTGYQDENTLKAWLDQHK